MLDAGKFSFIHYQRSFLNNPIFNPLTIISLVQLKNSPCARVCVYLQCSQRPTLLKLALGGIIGRGQRLNPTIEVDLKWGRDPSVPRGMLWRRDWLSWALFLSRLPVSPRDPFSACVLSFITLIRHQTPMGLAQPWDVNLQN